MKGSERDGEKSAYDGEDPLVVQVVEGHRLKCLGIEREAIPPFLASQDALEVMLVTY